MTSATTSKSRSRCDIHLETFLYLLQVCVGHLEHLQHARRSRGPQCVGFVCRLPHYLLPSLVHGAKQLRLSRQLSGETTADSVRAVVFQCLWTTCDSIKLKYFMWKKRKSPIDCCQLQNVSNTHMERSCKWYNTVAKFASI